jgi:hypothetical protein
VCCTVAEVKDPKRPKVAASRVPFFANKKVTALCIHRANHENAAGPQEPKDDRLKWWETRNEMQTTKAHVQDSRAKVSACCDLPYLGCARPSAAPIVGTTRALVMSTCQRSCSELRRQTSPLSFDSARLRDNRLVCTGAVCDQPTNRYFLRHSLAHWLPSLPGYWLRTCSVGRQYARVECRSEPLQNSGPRACSGISSDPCN